MGRYSDINKGPELAEAFKNLQEYRQKTRAQKQAAYVSVKKGNRQISKRIDGVIIPFSSKGNNTYLSRKIPDVSSNTESNDALTALAGYVLKAMPAGTGNVEITLPKFQAAKLILTSRSAPGNGQSRLTGAKYTQYTSDSGSCPFGKKDATDTFADVAKAVKAKLTNYPGGAKSARFVPERSSLSK